MDDDKQPENLRAQEFIGHLEFQLHQIVTSKDQTFLQPIVNPARKNNGKVKIVGEEKKESGQTAIMKLQGSIDQQGPLFFIVWKQLSPGQFKPVFKSEIQQP